MSEALAAGSETAFAASAQNAPLAPQPIPQDLVQVIAEATAVYAAVQAAGKDWYRSKTMWGALAALASGLTVIVLPVLHAPVIAYEVVGIIGALSGALAGAGRAMAAGPLK